MTLREHIKLTLRKSVFKSSQSLMDFMIAIDSYSDAELLNALEKIWTEMTNLKSFQLFLADELGLANGRNGITICYGGCRVSKDSLVARAGSFDEAKELMTFFGQYNTGWLKGVAVKMCDDQGIVEVAEQILSYAINDFPTATRTIITDDLKPYMLEYYPVRLLKCSAVDQL